MAKRKRRELKPRPLAIETKAGRTGIYLGSDYPAVSFEAVEEDNVIKILVRHNSLSIRRLKILPNVSNEIIVEIPYED